jgi:DNA-binding beta-propeller fold protein YncE
MRIRCPHAAIVALALSAGAACVHAPARAAAPEVRWPEPPAAARVRLATVLPDPDAPPPRHPWWRRALDLLTGVDAATEQAPMVRPFGVAAAGEEVVVADPDGASVLRLRGPEVTQVECRDLPWAAPMAVAVAPDGALVVADGGAARVVVVRPDGTCRALGAGELERPVSVAVDGERLLVADPPRHQIVALGLGGEILARWGRLGDGPGELHFPTSVAVAPDRSVLVVDALNFRVARLSSEGAWLGAFGIAGDAGGTFARPKAIAVDAAGRAYVSDAQRDVVLVFRPDGAFDCELGASGTAPGRLTFPAGLAIAGDRLLVADSMNRRVLVFVLLGDAP